MKHISSIEWSNSAPSLIRLLIVSYLVAVAFGMAGGTPLSIMLTDVMSLSQAHVVMGGLVVMLSGMIVADIARKTAGLVLAMLLFWASYLALFGAGSSHAQISSFWRDLALIGGLLAVVREPSNSLEEDFPNEQALVLDDTLAARRTSRGTTKFREDLEYARVS